MSVRTLGVVGAGQMGAGIAQVAAQTGIDVVIYDVSEEACIRGIAGIDHSLGRAVQRGRAKPDEHAEAMRRIRAAHAMEGLSQADFVIEAAAEDETVKLGIFKELDKICSAEVIFASNTSSISITRMAACTSRANRFIGMHFMNPAPVMKLVEIIRGLATDQKTYEVTHALAERLGKRTILSEDFPGFMVNRILLPMINEAVCALYEGVGRISDIDAAMKLGTNQPMGPLELADLIGLDTCLSIMEVMHRVFGDKYRPCPLLRKYVNAGRLGRKSGEGFYRYDERGIPIQAQP